MALADKPVALFIDQGARFYKKFLWRDKVSGDPIDLTGYKAHMQVRESADSDTALLTLSTEVLNPVKEGSIILGGSAGTIELEILAPITAVIDWRDATWDLKIFTDADHGDILVGGPVTFNRSNTII